MLDQSTKNRINECRNILVGKITDPKSQVEQITIALIYKFMDDMDTEAIEMGGLPTYFVGNYEKYSWKNIFSPRIGSDEMLNLYSEGMIKMHVNPNLPQLFRDIFKNAYLPYRDTETLKLFLKSINELKYDHSERLGDAFEYLLSSLGSQGDAGQFRTPRHIIDFIIEIVNPNKNQSMSDPACGSSGFLISGYKHILNSNCNKSPGDLLSSDERKKLMSNITGYDISPDMVRLSLVNLFLHGFSNPKIFEYDTLTSDDRWNDYFDVILANPPFMSPKGGIKPHGRFSIKSKKSEVLFVEYILEHLTPNGKSAIVIPEGVLCNTAKAYKKIRKKLIDENYLYGVVSLPSGVFLPYSDVKTSILLIDKEISKKTNDIIFVEVNNDGFQLGSTRRPIKENDIPESVRIIKQYQKSIISSNKFEYNINSNQVTIVSKEKILETPSISLSGKRYKDDIIIKSEFPIITLNRNIIQENKIKVKADIVNVWSVSNTQGFVRSDEYFGKQVASDDIKNYKKIFHNYFAYNPARINVGSISLNETEDIGCVSPMYVSFKIIDENIIYPKYLLLLLKSKLGIKQIRKFADGAVRQTLSFENLKFIQIPLPPIDYQKKIIDFIKKINKYQALIDDENLNINNFIMETWGINDEEIELEEIINDDSLDDDEDDE